MSIDKLWPAPAGLHIAPGDTGDADALARLHAQGFYRGWPKEDFAAYLAGRDTPVYVARDARGRVFGFAMIRLAADEAELITISVDNRRRSRGLGEALLRAVFSDLQMSPARRMFLEVAADNPAAIRLYEKLGFSRIAERTGYYERLDGAPATAIVMARDLV